jgi:transcription elongation factor Elf1
VIYEYWEGGKSRMTFNWKHESSLGPDYVPLDAFVCKSCGHIELIADFEVFIPITRRECPHCHALYSYRLNLELPQNIVRCSNCNKEFIVYPPKKCPSCGAVYLYNQANVVDETIVCQNCGKSFLFQNSDQSNESTSDIEDELLGE